MIDSHGDKEGQDTRKTTVLGDNQIAPRGFEPLSSNQQAPVDKQLTEKTNPVLSTGLDKIVQKYPDLRELVQLWPTLPESTRAAIMALVQTYAKGTE